MSLTTRESEGPVIIVTSDEGEKAFRHSIDIPNNIQLLYTVIEEE